MTGTKRTAAAVALAEFLPVPLLDTALQNQARRWLVRHSAPELDEDAVRDLADVPMEPMKRLAVWPVKFVLKKVFFVTQIAAIVRDVQDVKELPDRARELAGDDAGGNLAHGGVD